MSDPVVSPAVSAAMDYAVMLGLAVFPVGPDCRTPWCKHGYKDATKNPAELLELFNAAEGANVAVATGFISGVFVLDIDRKSNVDGVASLNQLQAEHGKLPATWRGKTPSGGFHVWFKQPDRGMRNRVGFLPGLDIRTTGGSVAVPPSKKPHGAYAWINEPTDLDLADAPAWLLDIIDPPPPPRPPMQPIQVHALDRTARYVLAAVDAECDHLARTQANTGRNMRLFQAAANLGELVGAGLLRLETAEAALERAADECGLLRDDGRRSVAGTIASGLRRGMANPREVKR